MPENGATTTTAKPLGMAKIAGIVSTVLWLLGFLLMFILQKDSQLMWLSDALLLIGFWPLLFVWRFSWPWIIFGASNVLIGFILLVAFYLPDSSFVGHPEMITARHHIMEYHSPWTWMVIGVISTIYGVIRMVKNIVIWYRARRKKTSDS